MGDTQSHLDIPCDGKRFEIGMMYDFCTEKLLKGFYLWDMKKLKENANTVEELGNFCEKTIIEDASEEKSHHVGASADANINFLSGLLKAEASTGYQYDRTISKKEARATFKFSCTTGYQEINNINIRSELDNKLYETALERKLCGATHVVVSVEYGCEAFFEFVRTVDEKEIKHDVHVEMKAALDRIPKCGGSLKMGASFERGYQEKIESYSCNFHGDFRLDPQPTTFEESIKAYKNLLHKDTERFPKAWKARIVPIIDIIKFYGLKVPDHPKFILKVHPISENLLSDTRNVLEKLRQKKAELQTLAEHVACKKLELPHLDEQVSDLAEKSVKVEKHFKQRISDLIPEIRSLKRKEEDLVCEIQNSMEDSNKVDVEFVKGRVSELFHYLDKVKVDGVSKIKLVPEAEVAVKSLEEQRLVCFAFNGDSTIKKSDQGTDIARRHDLFCKFKLFYDFAVANRKSKTSFIMTEKNPDASHLLNSDTGCLSGTISYRNCETSLFVPPSMLRHLHVARDPDSKATKLQWVEPESGTEHILYYIAMMTNKKLRTIHRRTNDKTTTTISIPDSELAVSISPNQEFTFSVRAVTPVGIGPEMKQVLKFLKVQLQVVP